MSPNGGINDFVSIGLISTSAASNYNALQLSVDKGLTHGLQMQVSYTYSHALDNASNYENSGYGGARGYNQYQPGLNYGNAAFDTRQRFVIAPIYVVPFKKGGSAFSPTNLLLSGWQVSAIMTFATGFPFDISYGGGTSRSLWCSANWSYYACPDIPEQVAAYQNLNHRTFHPNANGSLSNNTLGFTTTQLYRRTTRKLRQHQSQRLLCARYQQHQPCARQELRSVERRRSLSPASYGKRQRLQPHAVQCSNLQLHVGQLRSTSPVQPPVVSRRSLARSTSNLSDLSSENAANSKGGEPRLSAFSYATQRK